MSIPNMQWVIEDTRSKYPRAWDHCHHEGDPEALDFIILAAREMSVHDNATNVYGLNAKRGNYDDPSMDVIYAKDTSATDGVFDVVVGAGSSGASPAWNYLGPGNETSGYIDPWSLDPHHDYSGGGGGGTTPVPPTPAKPVWPPYESLGGDEGANTITRILEADYKSAGRPGLDGSCGCWLRRTDYDYMTGICATVEASVKKHRGEWLAELGLPADQPMPAV